VTSEHLKILVIGFGNPGRQDDGLGPAAAAEIEQLALPFVTVDADYQLTVEDAADIAAHDVVVLVDADCEYDGSFYFRRIEPQTTVSFSSHSVRPEAALGLAHELFAAETRGYILGIRGYRFNEFGEGLSSGATANLGKALRFLSGALARGGVPAEKESGIDDATRTGGENKQCATEST